MWEVKAAAGRDDELLAHVLAAADPSADVYRSKDGRVVVIDPTGRGVPDVPDRADLTPASRLAVRARAPGELRLQPGSIPSTVAFRGDL